jgi:hypothetical protein
MIIGVCTMSSMNKTKITTMILSVALVAGLGYWWFGGNRKSYPPYYGQVFLGLDAASSNAQLHFIAVGEKIYLDANQDNVADRDEWLTENQLPEIRSTDGKTAYQVHGLGLGIEPGSVSERLLQQVEMQVKVQLENGFQFQQAGNLLMSLQPADSAGLHFNGPLKMALNEPPTVIMKNADRPAEFQMTVATQAAEPGNKYRPAVLSPEADRETIPQLKIEYPAAGDGLPLIEDLLLDHFC